jgi:phage-related protein
MKKKAIYYEDNKGDKPAENFIDDLDLKIKAKVLARIEFLEEHWHELRRPYVDTIEDGLYELRVQFAKNKIRVIYAYMFKDYIVLLHGLIKATKQIPESDKLIAKRRRYDFQTRYKESKIRLKI